MRFASPRSPLSSRRAITARRKRSRVRAAALGTGAALGLIGLIAGIGAAYQASATSSARIAATTELSENTGLRHEQLSVYASIAAKTANDRAETTLVDAGTVISIMANKVDPTPLASSVAALGDYKSLDTDTVIELTQQTQETTATARSAVAEVDRAAAAAAAEADRVADAVEAAAQAQVAAQAAAARASVAEAPAQSDAGGNTPAEAKETARAMAASKYGWGESEFSCLVQLWTKESGWSYTATNPSGATGIPQALPGSKMATAGSDWATNATTQISWGLGYINAGYGTPCGAWAHSEANNWY